MSSRPLGYKHGCGGSRHRSRHDNIVNRYPNPNEIRAEEWTPQSQDEAPKTSTSRSIRYAGSVNFAKMPRALQAGLRPRNVMSCSKPGRRHALCLRAYILAACQNHAIDFVELLGGGWTDIHVETTWPILIQTCLFCTRKGGRRIFPQRCNCLFCQLP